MLCLVFQCLLALAWIEELGGNVTASVTIVVGCHHNPGL